MSKKPLAIRHYDSESEHLVNDDIRQMSNWKPTNI